jgi:hypothetical protein
MLLPLKAESRLVIDERSSPVPAEAEPEPPIIVPSREVSGELLLLVDPPATRLSMLPSISLPPIDENSEVEAAV